MKANEFDNKFESNEDILQHLDLSSSRRVNQEQRRVNVDFPAWMIDALDREAHRLGVTRQSVIKVWVADKLQKKAA
jgi:c-di-AMP phosphodiesterase-like protein